jgi:pyruvate, water dikinase
LILRVVDASNAYPANPILLKLADLSEDSPLGSHENGRVRGALRLLHQDSLRNPLLEALLFIRHKKGLSNVHIIIPFVRTVHEFLQLKRELAAKKLSRKNSLQIWMEVSVPENMLNLENYLIRWDDSQLG